MTTVIFISFAIFALGSCLSPPVMLPPCACPMNLRPVCGKNAEGVMTEYGNRCSANCQHATDIKDGPCDQHRGDAHHRLCGCPPIDDPVCALGADGNRRTFKNKCKAGCADATDITPGVCPGDHSTMPCACFKILAPVCATNSEGMRRDYGNKCEADCDHATDITQGPCVGQPPMPCMCAEIYAPVCGTSPEGMRKDYGNDCEAGCDHATDITQGPCVGQPPMPCMCAKMYAPVCGTSPEGMRKDYGNDCEAGCDHATDITPGPCAGTQTKLCGCPPIDDPVCGRSVPGGDMKTFFNKCELGCADTEYEMEHEGACEDIPPIPNHDMALPSDTVRLCGCPPIDEPVCGTPPNGQPTDYPNKCEAGCDFAENIIDGQCSA